MNPTTSMPTQLIQTRLETSAASQPLPTRKPPPNKRNDTIGDLLDFAEPEPAQYPAPPESPKFDPFA